MSQPSGYSQAKTPDFKEIRKYFKKFQQIGYQNPFHSPISEGGINSTFKCSLKNIQ